MTTAARTTRRRRTSPTPGAHRETRRSGRFPDPELSWAWADKLDTSSTAERTVFGEIKRWWPAGEPRPASTLVLAGTVGPGKTVGAVLVAARRGGEFLTAQSIGELEFAAEAKLLELIRPPLLVIDDLGEETHIGMTLGRVKRILKDRHAMQRTTMITTNLPPNRFRETYYDAVDDRVRSTGRIKPIVGPSRRHDGQMPDLTWITRSCQIADMVIAADHMTAVGGRRPDRKILDEVQQFFGVSERALENAARQSLTLGRAGVGMKRSAKFERKTPLRPGEPLRSRKRIKPLNRERVAEKHERNFGEEAERVRSLPCLACSKSCGSCTTFGWRKCWHHWAPRSVAAHVTARGMGGTKGGRLDLVPLCDAHHREAGEAETSQRAAFEQRYGLDLRAKADHIALEHPRPLGIRGLVDRWLVDYVYAKSFPGAGDPGWLKHRPLDTYETKALLGWCRREMEGACMPGVFAGAVAESGLGGEREVAVNVVALWIPWFELVGGVLLLLGLWVQGSVFLLTGLLLVFLGALGFNLGRGLDVACGCFSTSSKDSVTARTLLRDSLFLVVALYLFWLHHLRGLESRFSPAGLFHSRRQD